jgi:alkylmercury lyase
VSEKGVAPRQSELLEALLNDLVTLRPSSRRTDQEFALHLFRLLARGRPVRREELAASLNRSSAEVWETVKSWPRLIQLDEERRIVSFGGLTLEPTRHTMSIDGNTLYAWCAWDTLFIPEILSKTVDVASTCPQTGQLISLTVSPTRVRADKPGIVLSLPNPGLAAMEANARASFCEYVFFFESLRAGTAWIGDQIHLTFVSLDDAFALGRRKNAMQFNKLTPGELAEAGRSQNDEAR